MPNLDIGRPPSGRRLAATLLCAAAIAGCASSSTPSTSSTSNDPALAYARCLRTHGLPNFPDPNPGSPVRIPSNINTQAPAFNSAQQACASLIPANSDSRASTEGRRVQLLAVAKCMRKHGVPGFHDPMNSPPPPSDGNAIGANGVYLSIGPPAGRQSPAFKQAAAACRLP